MSNISSITSRYQYNDCYIVHLQKVGHLRIVLYLTAFLRQGMTATMTPAAAA